MPALERILDQLKKQAEKEETRVSDSEILEKINYVCRCEKNRAPTRFLMACLLAKVENPSLDIRQPYTEIGEKKSFSGRKYDEAYIGPFINRHKLPCNSTTAFLTPALRNIDEPLTKNVKLVGEPRKVYDFSLEILDAVEKQHVGAIDVLREIIRQLLILRDEREQGITALLKKLKTADNERSPSVEMIINVMGDLLAEGGTSRLPVLIIAAAYRVAQKQLGEQILHLHSHTAADEQTGAVGDIEIVLADDDKVVTAYEVKDKPVVKSDLDRALQKIGTLPHKVDNYVFVSTEDIEREVLAYAAGLHKNTGIDFIVLDCLGFLRFFLTLFFRLRVAFLDEFQRLVLAEPESSIRSSVKKRFLEKRSSLNV